MRHIKRQLACLLTVCMLLTMLPLHVFAAEDVQDVTDVAADAEAGTVSDPGAYSEETVLLDSEYTSGLYDGAVME